MTERQIRRGQRVLVWATVKEPTNEREPTGTWWIAIDGHAGLSSMHEDMMVIAHGESTNKEEA